MVLFLIIVGLVCGFVWINSINKKDGSVNKNGKYFGWGCIVAIILVFYVSDQQKKEPKRTGTHINGEQIHFGGSSSEFRHYPCPVGGCLCTKYEAKGIANTYCSNCGHPKHKSKYD